MKVVNKLITLFFSMMLIACSGPEKNTHEKEGKSFGLRAGSAEKSLRKTFSLLTNNLEIPNECKPPMANESNKRAFVKLRGRVNRCVFYIPQIPSLNNVNEVRHCLQEIGLTFDDVSDQTCRDLVTVPGATGNIVDVMNNLLSNFYTAKVRVVESNETVFKWENVQDYFSLWAHWFNQTRASMYKLDSTEVISDAHVAEFENNIHRPFWNDVQAYTPEWKSTFGDIVKEIEPTNPDGSPRTPEEIAELRLDKNNKFEIFKAMLSVNKKIIDLAFTSDLGKKETYWTDASSQKEASPLLASILGSAIQPFFERIQVITKIYDVACKLKNCTEDFYHTNKTFWMVKYLKSISDGGGVESIDLDRTEPLNDFLMTLVDRETEVRSLVTAINSAFNVSKISTAVPGTDFPNFLASFADIFSQSHDLLQNYENTKVVDKYGVVRAGYFSSGRINEVNVGFSKANMNRHIANVKNSNNKLITLRDKFASQKHTLIQEVLALNSSQIQLSQLEDKINIDLTDMMNTKNQIDAIRSFIQNSKENFSEKVKKLIENQPVSNKEFFTYPTETFVANATGTSVGNPGVIDAAVLANVDPTHNFKKGDLLQVAVSGEWSPSCAISGTYGAKVIGAKTSGKGYTLINTQGEGIVKSVDEYGVRETFSSLSVSVSTCGGGEAFGNGTKTCLNASAGIRNQDGRRDSTNSSTTNRSDASFDIGVTLENTPFPFLPAGSLMLVVMPRGENRKAEYHNIYTLNGNDTFVVDRDDLDFYLIGNDCNAASNSGSLTVKLTRQSPAGSQAVAFIDKIGSLAESVQQRVQGLINAGQLSHQLLQSIRSELLGAVGADINSFNGTIRQFLESYIANEMAILDYKSQLTNMERLLEAKKQNLISLVDQFTSENEQRYLRVSTRNWLISNMDLDFVNQADENKNLYTLNRILNTLEHSLVSYLDFKYRNEERDFILGDLSLLNSIDISDNFDTISKRITTYVATLLDNLEADLNNKPLVPQTTVGIRIANPFYEPTFQTPFPDNSVHPKMNEVRATNFWNKLVEFERFSDVKVDFDIEIEDLYTDYGLSCYTETPIIETMGLFFIPENEGYVTDFNNNFRHKNSKLYIDGLSQIPFENTLRTYNFVDFAWRYMDAATRMAISPNDAMRILVEEFPPRYDVETGLGTGRPIFGKFKIGDLKGLRRVNGEVYIGHTPIKEIKELFIGYVVSASNNNFDINLNWIDYCKAN